MLFRAARYPQAPVHLFPDVLVVVVVVEQLRAAARGSAAAARAAPSLAAARQRTAHRSPLARERRDLFPHRAPLSRPRDDDCHPAGCSVAVATAEPRPTRVTPRERRASTVCRVRCTRTEARGARRTGAHARGRPRIIDLYRAA